MTPRTPERTKRTSTRIVSISVAAGLGAAALAGTATASPTFPGENGRMAVVVTRPDDASRPTDVMTMNPDGSHRKLIVHTRAKRDAGPTNIAFSPNGRRMVFDRRACPDGCHYNVGVVSSGGSHRRLLTRRRHGFDTNFGFSPDGHRIGFVRGFGDIYVVGTHGRHKKRLTHYAPGVAVTDRSFSPDSRSVYFHKFVAGQQAGSSDTICVVTISSRQESCLGEGSYPRWAPDGRSILFTDPSASGIYTMKPDGSDRTLLISGSRVRPLEFSPDGKHFAYLRETRTGRKVYVAKSDGTQRRTITHDHDDFEASLDMAFSPDGKRLIYRGGSRKRVYASRIDGSHHKRIGVTPWRLEAPNGVLAWAPRG